MNTNPTDAVLAPASLAVFPTLERRVISILDHFGAILQETFVKGVPIAEEIANIAEPVVAIEFPAVAALFNTTLHIVSNAQAMGMAASGGQPIGAAKLALASPVVESVAEGLFNRFGIHFDPATANAWTTGVVNLAKLIPAPPDSPANKTVA